MLHCRIVSFGLLFFAVAVLLFACSLGHCGESSKKAVVPEVALDVIFSGDSDIYTIFPDGKRRAYIRKQETFDDDGNLMRKFIFFNREGQVEKIVERGVGNVLEARQSQSGRHLLVRERAVKPGYIETYRYFNAYANELWSLDTCCPAEEGDSIISDNGLLVAVWDVGGGGRKCEDGSVATVDCVGLRIMRSYVHAGPNIGEIFRGRGGAVHFSPEGWYALVKVEEGWGLLRAHTETVEAIPQLKQEPLWVNDAGVVYYFDAHSPPDVPRTIYVTKRGHMQVARAAEMFAPIDGDGSYDEYVFEDHVIGKKGNAKNDFRSTPDTLARDIEGRTYLYSHKVIIRKRSTEEIESDRLVLEKMFNRKYTSANITKIQYLPGDSAILIFDRDFKLIRKLPVGKWKAPAFPNPVHVSVDDKFVYAYFSYPPDLTSLQVYSKDNWRLVYAKRGKDQIANDPEAAEYIKRIASWRMQRRRPDGVRVYCDFAHYITDKKVSRVKFIVIGRKVWGYQQDEVDIYLNESGRNYQEGWCVGADSRHNLYIVLYKSNPASKLYSPQSLVKISADGRVLVKFELPDFIPGHTIWSVDHVVVDSNGDIFQVRSSDTEIIIRHWFTVWQ